MPEYLVFLFCHDQPGILIKVFARGIQFNLWASSTVDQAEREQDKQGIGDGSKKPLFISHNTLPTENNLHLDSSPKK
jgi:hypothetical protein